MGGHATVSDSDSLCLTTSTVMLSVKTKGLNFTQDFFQITQFHNRVVKL